MSLELSETGLWTLMKLKSQNHWLLSDMGTTEVTEAQRGEHEYAKVSSGDLGLDLTWPDSHGPGRAPAEVSQPEGQFSQAHFHPGDIAFTSNPQEPPFLR